MSAQPTRKSSRITSETREKLRKSTHQDNNLGELIQDKVPYSAQSFTRPISYTYNPKDKTQYKLSNENELGIVNWASVPIPVGMMAKLTGNKHKANENDQGFFCWVVYDNSDHYLIVDATKLMADDDEYRDHILSATDIPYISRVTELYKLSLGSREEQLKQERRRLGAIAVKQAFYRLGHKINTRLVFKNPFKGLARSIAPLDLNNFEAGGHEKIESLFDIKGTHSGTKWLFEPIDEDILNEFIGLEVMSKYDAELGSIFIEPEKLVYDTAAQELTLYYAFQTGKEQNHARSCPKIKKNKTNKRRKRKRKSKKKTKNTKGKAKKRRTK